MEALATPTISILAPQGAYTFTRTSAPGKASAFRAEFQNVAQLKRTRPATVFDIASRLQLVPRKLFRHEDRVAYMRGQYPMVSPDKVATVMLPLLDAVGVYERTDASPDAIPTGHHVAELLLARVVTLMASSTSTLAALFVIRDAMWIVLAKRGEVSYLQTHHLAGAEDAVFYVKAMMEQYGLEAATTPVFAGGSFTAEGQLGRLLSIYFDVRELTSVGANQSPAGELGAHELLAAYEHALRRNIGQGG